MKNTVKALELIILIVVMIGFLVIFISEVSSAWKTHRALITSVEENNEIESETNEAYKADKNQSEAKLYIATAISAFMTAFFANKMGVEVPAPEDEGNKKDENTKKSLKDRVEGIKKKIKNLIKNFDNTKVSIGSFYLIVYFIIALIAIITWATIPDQTPAVVKNVASISVTMFIGIAKTVLDTIPD